MASATLLRCTAPTRVARRRKWPHELLSRGDHRHLRVGKGYQTVHEAPLLGLATSLFTLRPELPARFAVQAFGSGLFATGFCNRFLLILAHCWRRGCLRPGCSRSNRNRQKCHAHYRSHLLFPLLMESVRRRSRHQKSRPRWQNPHHLSCLVRYLVEYRRPPNPVGDLVLGRRPPNPVGDLVVGRLRSHRLC
jgi:hypothetical protein